MSRVRISPAALGAAVLAPILIVSGCTSAGASATPAPTESAMIEHSPSPEASAMMEHSPSPAAAAPVSSGTFHKVDGSAQGTVALFHNADGTFTITFEDFAIDSAANTHVILVTNKDVTKDGDVDKTAIVDLGALKGTSGMQDFPVPAAADAMTYHTVVLWDTEMAHAIAAAPLQ
ncbi:MAG: DM13 domain-containing protein [Chloroflexota bacterium]